MDTIMDFLAQIGLTEFEVISLIRILVASICGGIIGLEREMKGRPAGLKTFSLVCVGAALVMVTNEYIFLYIAHSSGDSARMGAQVISGIGFLGAGTILVTGHSQIKGLTTAAALWVTAAIGIAIGTGFYFGGLAGVILIYLTSKVYSYFDNIIMKSSKIVRLYVEGISNEFLLGVLEYLNANDIKITDMKVEKENKWYKEDHAATIEVILTKKISHDSIRDGIKQLEGFRYINEI